VGGAPILSAADHEFWRENGYLVVPNAVPRAYCEAVKAVSLPPLYHPTLAHPSSAPHSRAQDLFTGLGLDPRSPDSWYTAMPERFRGGFVRMTQAQSMWNCRQCPRVHQIFSELHGTARLSVSQDQAHMKLCARPLPPPAAIHRLAERPKSPSPYPSALCCHLCLPSARRVVSDCRRGPLCRV